MIKGLIAMTIAGALAAAGCSGTGAAWTGGHMGLNLAKQDSFLRVSLDGQSPDAAHGLDINEDGDGTVAEQRLYQLIRQPRPIVDRTFEIEFLDAGVETFAFTFG